MGSRLWKEWLFVLRHGSLSVYRCAASLGCCQGLCRITTLLTTDTLQFDTVRTCRIPFCPTTALTLRAPVIWTLERDPRQHCVFFFPPSAEAMGCHGRPGGTVGSKRLRSHSGNTETGEEDSGSTSETPAGSNGTSDQGCLWLHRGKCRGGGGVQEFWAVQKMSEGYGIGRTCQSILDLRLKGVFCCFISQYF